jgi:hypothetical protein
LEKILEQMHKPHKDFRLWLTTMPQLGEEIEERES